MTANAASCAEVSKTPQTRRLLFAAALLGAEYVIALFFFDSQRLPGGERSRAFALLGKSMPLIIVLMTATLLVGGGPSDDEKRRIAPALHWRKPIWPWLVGHALVYVAALGITIFVFNANLGLSHPWLWIALWAGSTVTSLFLLLAAVVPRSALAPLARPALRALGSGLLIGELALLESFATSWLWRWMSSLTLEVVASLHAVTGHEVVRVPEELVIGTPTYYEVFVDPQCSGYEGIGLNTVLPADSREYVEARCHIMARAESTRIGSGRSHR